MQPRFCRILVAFLIWTAISGTLPVRGQAPNENWAGTYATQVSLLHGQNTCGAVSVQNNETTVDHTKGEDRISITHAGNTYEGTVDDSGHFKTKPRTLPMGDSEYTISIVGRFSSTGFDATVTVEVKQPSSPSTCSYKVVWKGKKRATDSVDPGFGLNATMLHVWPKLIGDEK
jgi:hypothetical protein